MAKDKNVISIPRIATRTSTNSEVAKVFNLIAKENIAAIRKLSKY